MKDMILNKVNIIYIILVIVFAATQVILLNQDSTLGAQLTSLQLKEEEILNLNSHLDQQIASASSLSTIVVKAGKYGFSGKQNIVYISTSLPIAYNNSSAF